MVKKILLPVILMCYFISACADCHPIINGNEAELTEPVQVKEPPRVADSLSDILLDVLGVIVIITYLSTGFYFCFCLCGLL
jgi:hypothetical protein